MYGLFEYSYDYYEWENLICVSDSVDRLKEYYKDKSVLDDPLVSSDEEHDHLASCEKYHYQINRVLLVV